MSFYKIFIVSLVLTINVLAHAQNKIDISEHNKAAVQKLETILLNLNKTEPSYPLTLSRVAQLYSEIATHEFNKQIETNCENCTEAADLRKISISKYNELLKFKISEDQKADIHLQLAILYQQTSQSDKSLDELNILVKTTSKKSYNNKAISNVALLQRGHYYFIQSEFKKAKNDYEKVQKDLLNSDDQQLYLYRLAYTYTSLNQINLAKNTYENLIKQINLSHSDIQFDVYYDYSKLLIDNIENQKKVTQIILLHAEKLDPKLKTRLLFQLGDETYRIQKFIISEKLYSQIEPQLLGSQLDQLKIKLRLISIKSHYNNKAPLESFKILVQESSQCESTTCKPIKTEIRQFVLDTHKLKKSKPDEQILNLYLAYLEIYKDEPVLFLTAAEIAQFINKVQIARSLFESAILLETNSKLKEEYLQTNIHRAQASGDINDKKLSYLFYLKHGSQTRIKNEITFELAQNDFNQKQFDKSYPAFDSIAKSPIFTLKQRQEAMRLALESLIQLKNHSQIIIATEEYKNIFKSEYNYLSKIQLTAQINNINLKSNEKYYDTSSANTQFEEQKKLISSISDKTVKKEQIKKLFEYANKSNSFENKTYALILLATQTNLTRSEKNETLSELYNLYLQSHNYPMAFELSKKYPELKISYFNQAVLAELALLPNQAKIYYEKSLSEKLNLNQKMLVIERLITISPNPDQVIKKNITFLKSQPRFFDKVTSYLILKYKEPTYAMHLGRSSNYTKLTQTALSRLQLIPHIQSSQKLLQSLGLNFNPKSISAYKTQLQKLDQLLTQSVQAKNIQAQSFALLAIHIENLRFAKKLALLSDKKPELKASIIELSKPYLEKSFLAKHSYSQLMTGSVYPLWKKEINIGRYELFSFYKSEYRYFQQLVTEASGLKLEFNSLISLMEERYQAWLDLRKNGIINDQGEQFASLESQFGSPLVAQINKNALSANK